MISKIILVNLPREFQYWSFEDILYISSALTDDEIITIIRAHLKK